MAPRRDDRLSREDYRILQRYDAAMALMEAGRDKAAAKQLRAIIREVPTLRPALFHLHALCAKHGWHDLLLETLEDAHRSGEWDSDLLEDLVYLSFSMKRREETRRYLLEFQKNFPRQRKIGPWWIKDIRHWVLSYGDNPCEASPSPDQMTLWSGGDERAAPQAPARAPSKPRQPSRVQQTPKKKATLQSPTRAPSKPSRPAPAARPPVTKPLVTKPAVTKPPISKPAVTKPPAATTAPAPPPAETILARPILGPLQVTITVEGPDLAARLTQGEWNVRSHHDLCLSAHHLSMVNGIDELLCLSNIQGVRELWYQVETVRKVLRRFRGRALLCDEVGLGKTIEAGMIIKEYMLRGLIRSVLVLVPPSLVAQWHEELLLKFGIDCATSADPLFKRDPEAFWQEKPLIIASLASAKSARHAPLLTARPYDLIIVDEAHHLRNRNTQAWKLINRLKSRFLLLLTATPLQNNLEELHNLITLLKPGQLKTRATFLREFVSKEDPTVPVNEEKLRELLSGVMIRNTRALAGLHLPARHASTVTVDPSPAEKELYDRISNLVRTGYRGDGSGNGLNRLTLRLLQSEAGSSPRALLKTLEKIPESAELLSLADIARSLDSHTKLDALAVHLQTTREKTIVFVSFRETLAFSAENLRRRGLEVILFHGGLSAREKEAAIDAFRDGGRTLLTTEVGGEGRNLQFCHRIVNFDLPWNPMRIEQRIGRIHRIGQEKEIEIVN
ncbi:MAG: DEAD/DEAH box helicase family protein, partial [Candidatus Eisenbacteria bacterium]|nr:DEAD/DEAH box helicase family protein [Candidatus Eisenbacteria bacterium]